MTKAKPADDKMGEFAWVALTGLWLLFWRAALKTPWGFTPQSASGGLLNVGIVCNPVDTWSYLSWVHQYAHGENLAGLTYTTEPHAALLWLFPLWLMGKVAAWSGLSVIGTYNAFGIPGAMLAVFCFLRAARTLDLSPSARHWAAFAFVIGSGGSWLWHIAHKLGLASRANGGDLFFLDLFPSTTFIAYAYHTLGLALLAALWWSVNELELRRLAGEPFKRGLIITIFLAGLLAFSRPYEPIAFLGAWMLKTLWHGWHRQQAPAIWKNSVFIAAFLVVALLPGIAWTVWVSSRPVWSSFAHASLTLGLDRIGWVFGLGGWAVLVALGIQPAWRADPRRAALPLAASILMVTLLVGLGSGYTKLASGLVLGPIFLSGWGSTRLIAALGNFPRLLQIGAAGAALAALLGVPSLHMNFNAIKLNGPALVDSDVVQLANELQPVSGHAAPIVLTDAETGGVLPGLVGARVYVGHWSLSGHYDEKVAQLDRAGLNPRVRSGNALPENPALEKILTETSFDYALLDNRVQSPIAALRNKGWKPVDATRRWTLLRAPSP